MTNLEKFVKRIVRDIPEPLRRNHHTGLGYHGSLKGEEIELKMFWDPFYERWTTKELAIEGEIYRHLQPTIRHFIADKLKPVE